MKRREWIALMILAMAAVPALLIGVGQIYVNGINGPRLRRPETLWLLGETAALFALCFLACFRVERTASRLGILTAVAACFLWLHQALLPMALSGLYILFLLKVGSVSRKLLDQDGWFPDGHAVTAMADFILGCGTMILLFCLLSLAGLGGIGATRILTLGLLAALYTPFLAERSVRFPIKDGYRKLFTEKEQRLSLGVSILFAILFAMVLLQAGRMNICADYDSIHYGLRSEYLLDNGRGIYENLGTLNVVYTYSKGLEILLLPISGLPSYGFFLSFQIWMTLGILLMAGKLTELFVSRKYGFLTMALLSLIPGVMNMSITAKTDAATALFQLMMLYFLLLYIKKQRSCYLTLAVDAFLMTMVLKPTAIVFSTIAAGTAGLYILCTRQLRFRRKGSFWPSWLLMGAMWLLVWFRTWLHTGLPVTSVFNSIWAMLGFQVRYPYRFESLPSNGGALFSVSGLKHFVKRLYGVLAAPVGEDMAHVWIAWGTSLLVVFLLLLLFPLAADLQELKKREKRPLICLGLVLFTNGAASLAALYLLWQVDGNYFMLLYCLLAVAASVVLGKLKSQVLAHAVMKLFIPFALFNVTVTAVSNWGGVLGFTPICLFHKGYYDHKEEAREQMADGGNEKIWDILAADSRNRVVVFGDSPEMLRFPCSAQSYTDIEGSGGNFYISASPEAMASFFDFASVDYVYLGSGYLKPGTEGWRNVTELISSGYVTDLVYENGNGLGRFQSTPAEGGEAALLEFSEKYWPGDQQ